MLPDAIEGAVQPRGVGEENRSSSNDSTIFGLSTLERNEFEEIEYYFPVFSKIEQNSSRVPRCVRLLPALVLKGNKVLTLTLVCE